MNVFFTSDTHFDHTRIIELSHRPFKSCDEMNETMVDGWNSVVGAQDTVYHLGDFAFAKTDRVEQILRRLNGHKHLIEGNHDHDCVIRAKGWASIKSYRRLKDLLPTSIILFHYPIDIWDRRHHGAIHLFGHIHEQVVETSQQLRRNVGVDANGFKPIPLEMIKQLMEFRTGATIGPDWSDQFQKSRLFDESIPHFYRKQDVFYPAEPRKEST